MTTTAPQSPSSLPCPLWARIIATGFGSGLLKPAPGTWGSLLGLILSLASVFFFDILGCTYYGAWDSAHRRLRPVMSSDAFWFALPCVLLASVLGVIAASIYSKRTGIKDPHEVVIDEIAGQGLALLGIALVDHNLVNWTQVIVEISAAFALFRLFDIWKPWPIRRLEKLPGGWGIMADDLAAGAISALILALLIHLRWLPGL